MPNHVSNRVFFQSLIEGDYKSEEAAFEQLQTLMKTDRSPFDFNVLIPYPENFKILDDARAAAEKVPGVKWADLPKDGFNQGGYEWCVANWGTKWDAYDIGIDYEDITFNTAWATPEPIWIALSKHFPNVKLMVEYASEDTGRNCGILAYFNGKQVSKTIEEGLPDPVAFARAIVAEQRAAHNFRELKEAESKIKELEEQLASYRANMTAI